LPAVLKRLTAETAKTKFENKSKEWIKKLTFRDKLRAYNGVQLWSLVMLIAAIPGAALVLLGAPMPWLRVAGIVLGLGVFIRMFLIVLDLFDEHRRRP